MLRKLNSLAVFILLILASAACAGGGATAHEVAVRPSSNTIEPAFRDFYEKHGGEEVLGAAISDINVDGERKFQFTVAAQLVYDPLAPARKRVHLALLGADIGFREPASPPPATPDPRYINGHYIFPDFLASFQKLGGAEIVGQPLTEVHYNPEKKRYEQYFENLGFYRLDGEPPGTAHLLAYGVWKCSFQCQFRPPEASIVAVQPPVRPPISEAVARLGTDLTGFAITEAYAVDDHMTEQVFENLVFFFDTNNPGRIGLRTLPGNLGVTPAELSSPSKDPGMFFYAIQDGKGYNVSQHFLDYITAHGGMDIFGAPVSEQARTSSNVLRQCFVNLCLDFTADGIVRPVPLGYSYKESFYHPLQAEATSSGPAREVSLHVSVEAQMVSPLSKQRIYTSIQENGAPLSGIAPTLVITRPDGTQQTFTMPETGADGQVRFDIPAIVAPNGTLIPYQVCISSASGEKYCFKDSYMIWNNP